MRYVTFLLLTVSCLAFGAEKVPKEGVTEKSKLIKLITDDKVQATFIYDKELDNGRVLDMQFG